MKTHIFLAILVIVALFSAETFAQYPEDILRIAEPGIGVGARAVGLGLEYAGVANDYSAIYWNPAGLGQLKMNEFSFGLSQLSFSNDGSYYGNSQSFSNSSTNLNTLGLVYSVPTERGSLVIAFGYDRQSDFTTGLSFDGFNPSSSIIQSWAPDGRQYPSDLSGNAAYQLYLANIDTLTGLWDSKIKDSLRQTGTVIEGGGINHYSFAAAVEASPHLYLGLTLSIVSGSYTYDRQYAETDSKNVHNTFPFDLTSLTLLEHVNSDITGFGAKLGLLYDFSDNSRIGLTIATPTWVTVKETFTQNATSLFDNNQSYNFGGEGSDEYDASTPFVFTLAGSYGIRYLMLTGAIEYTDWTQMEFRNADPSLLDYNTTIKEDFHATTNLHVGAEYEIVPGEVQIRAGYAYLPSPYAADAFSSGFAKKYITGGLSFSVANAVIVELGYAHGMWKDYVQNYSDPTSTVSEDVKTNTFLGTISYRF
ncbi:MAG TPA: outer membrane protein transport protein [Bacteroidota bacterium]|nr:outer membrane protein transport protein [Bacteroidota bacterium]